MRKLPLCASPGAPRIISLFLPLPAPRLRLPGAAVILWLSASPCLESPLAPLSPAQVLLRVKENELQYVKKEVQCLREELQMMQKVGAGLEPPSPAH